MARRRKPSAMPARSSPDPFVVGTAVRDRHDHTPRAGLQIGPAIRTARDYPRKTTHTRPRDNERIRCDAVTGAALPLSARGLVTARSGEGRWGRGRGLRGALLRA